MSESVCIVGAGLGGTTLAALLSKRGYRVTVIEKQPTSCGRCNSFNLGRYRFDVGASMIMLLDTFHKLESILDEDVLGRLDLLKCEPNNVVYFEDDDKFTVTTDLELMKSEFGDDEETMRKYITYLKDGAEHYKVARDSVLSKSYSSLVEAITMENLRGATKLGLRNIFSYAMKLFNGNRRLAKVFSFQVMYMGVSPLDAISAYTMLPYSELTSGIWYPRGGMSRIPDTMHEIALESNTVFRFNEDVRRIDLGAAKPKIVTTKHGEEEFDYVVSNADLPSTYKYLLNDSDVTEVLDDMEYGCSTISFYWGVSKVVEGLKPHQIFFGKSFEEAFDDIFSKRTVPQEISFYVHAPSTVDASSCPQGSTSVIVLVPVGSETVEDSVVDRCRHSVLDCLRRHNIHIAKSDIEHERVITPQIWKEEFTVAKGAALGLNHSIHQMGPFRPSNTHHTHPRMFFVGASTQPGAGVPSVVHSAMNVAELISDRTDRTGVLMNWLTFHSLLKKFRRQNVRKILTVLITVYVLKKYFKRTFRHLFGIIKNPLQ